MKAYKVFDKNLCCRGFQYKVGETYSIPGAPVLCLRGFHACKNVARCFDYYDFSPENRIAIVDLIGKIDGDDGPKQCTNKIKIIKELSWSEMLNIANSGSGNSGNRNSGHRNSGDRNSGNLNSGNCNSGNWNSGDRNSGNWNSGDWNSGHRNSGHRNSGNRNSGHRNSGDRNSGNWNSGDQNSGNWNSGDQNSGYLNSNNPTHGRLFNKTVEWEEINNFLCSEAYKILCRFRLVSFRVRTHTGKFGDYRYLSYKDSWHIFWNNLPRTDKITVANMNHFDPQVFEEITGIDARKYIKESVVNDR